MANIGDAAPRSLHIALERASCARCPSGVTGADSTVAGGSAAALICDTGALLDYLVAQAPDHERFRTAIDRARARYVPGLVLAELDHSLRDDRRAMHAFLDDLARGAFTYAPPSLDRLALAMEIDRRYADLGLGLVDASVVALAEAVGVRRIATRETRHFAAVRLRDGSALDLVVQPAAPDRS